jgi:hypothetical protein
MNIILRVYLKIINLKDVKYDLEISGVRKQTFVMFFPLIVSCSSSSSPLSSNKHNSDED